MERSARVAAAAPPEAVAPDLPLVQAGEGAFGHPAAAGFEAGSWAGETRSSVERFWHLDAARATLMLLGIVFHSAQVYGTGSPWRVQDPSGAAAFTWMALCIHSFRMQAFFWVAGFFTAMGLDRLRPAAYVRVRARRLLVPLLATLFTFNIGEYLLARVLPIRPASGDSGALGHLWFLVDLMIFTSLTALILRRRGRVCGHLESLGERIRNPMTLLSILAVVSAGSVLTVALFSTLSGYEPTGILGLTSIDRLLVHAPFFVFGVLVYRSRTLGDVFGAIHPAWMLLAVPLNVWLARDADLVPSWSLLLLLQGFLTWLTVGAVMSAFARFSGRPGRIKLWLAEASYPIYLCHHLLVLLFGALLISVVGPPATIKFITLMTVVAVLSLGFAWWVQRSDVLRFLFTGR